MKLSRVLSGKASFRKRKILVGAGARQHFLAKQLRRTRWQLGNTEKHAGSAKAARAGAAAKITLRWAAESTKMRAIRRVGGSYAQGNLARPAPFGKLRAHGAGAIGQKRSHPGR